MGSPTAPPPNVGPVMNSTQAQAMAPGRTKMRALLADRERRARVWDQIAEGMSVADIARLNGIPYLIFYRVIKDQCGDEYAAARAAYADSLVKKNLDLADSIEAGRVGAPEGKAASGIRQWYAERADPDTWGQKSSMNVHHTGVIGLHMQALRDFQQEQEVEAEDAEFEEVVDYDEREVPTQQDDPAGHPLL